MRILRGCEVENMDSYRVVELLEYIKTFDEHSSGATKIALDKAIVMSG